MGIREYFKQHPEDEDLKLHGLKLEKKERRKNRFDEFEEMITDEEWEAMKEALRELKEEIGFVERIDFAELIVKMKIIFSDREEELRISSDEMENIFDEMNFYKRAGGIELLCESAAYYKILTAGNYKLEDKEINYLHNKFLAPIHGRIAQYGQFLEPIVLLKIAASENFSEFKKKFASKQETSFDLLKQEFEQNPSDARLGGCVRIIFPERFSELKIDDKELKDRLKLCKKFLQEGHVVVKELIDLLFYIKILMAKEVRTDHGLELIMDEGESLKAEKSKRPERRSF